MFSLALGIESARGAEKDMYCLAVAGGRLSPLLRRWRAPHDSPLRNETKALLTGETSLPVSRLSEQLVILRSCAEAAASG